MLRYAMLCYAMVGGQARPPRHRRAAGALLLRPPEPPPHNLILPRPHLTGALLLRRPEPRLVLLPAARRQAVQPAHGDGARYNLTPPHPLCRPADGWCARGTPLAAPHSYDLHTPHPPHPYAQAREAALHLIILSSAPPSFRPHHARRCARSTGRGSTRRSSRLTCTT